MPTLARRLPEGINEARTMTPSLDADLETRQGWPEELRFLLARYPREQWLLHANLGTMTHFWLGRHKMFRELGRALQDATARFREGSMHSQEFQAWFAPRLQFFLSQLNEHHHVEDFHYFPIFRTAEARLLPGFELLEKDHEILHACIVESVDVANAFLRSLHDETDKRRFAADRYVETNDRLLRQMLRHLDDEEDLIIPLILDRGEQALGIE